MAIVITDNGSYITVNYNSTREIDVDKITASLERQDPFVTIKRDADAGLRLNYTDVSTPVVANATALEAAILAMLQNRGVPQNFTATTNQTILTVTGVPSTSSFVFVNGYYIPSTGNWTVSGNTVVFNTGLNLGDQVSIII